MGLICLILVVVTVGFAINGYLMWHKSLQHGEFDGNGEAQSERALLSGTVCLTMLSIALLSIALHVIGLPLWQIAAIMLVGAIFFGPISLICRDRVKQAAGKKFWEHLAIGLGAYGIIAVITLIVLQFM